MRLRFESLSKSISASFVIVTSLVVMMILPGIASANVDLVLSAPVTVLPVEPGSDTIVEVHLRAVWDGTIADPLCQDPPMGDPTGELFQSIDAIIQWDPAVLELLGSDSSTADYSWLLEGIFPGDPDGWNNGNDGAALWQAGSMGLITAVGGNGRLATIFRFKALSASPGTQVSLLDSPGAINNTDVINCNFGNIVGDISAVATVQLIACPDVGADADSDGFRDACDNCPNDANADQADGDTDGIGDACDPCPNDPTNDADSDGICGIDDNCPDDPNPLQEDADMDGPGDACDNCPMDSNADQSDGDGDGVGDVCDPCPNRRPGDVSGDDVTNEDDIPFFVIVALQPELFIDTDEFCAADVNEDLSVDGLDVQFFLGVILAP